MAIMALVYTADAVHMKSMTMEFKYILLKRHAAVRILFILLPVKFTMSVLSSRHSHDLAGKI